MTTEKDWCRGHDAIAMTAFVQARLGERKLRLIAAACCRLRKGLTESDGARDALRAAEDYADGRIDAAAFTEARQRVLDATAWAGDWADETPEENVARALRSLMQPKAGAALREVIDALERAAHLAGSDAADRLDRSRRELVRQASVLREVAGNPFRPAVVAPQWKAWHGDCLVELARDIYRMRAFHDLPLLGDVLEDAGCDDTELLDHCRGDGAHAVGCWLLDEILGHAT